MKRFIGKLVRKALDWSDAAWTPLSGGGGGVSSLLSVSGVSQPAQHVLMVFACLTARREAIGGVPLRISDADGNLVEDGDAARLLAAPNGVENWDQYIRKIETYLTLYDALAILPVREGSRISELVALNPSGLRPVPGIHQPSGTPAAIGWEYRDPVTFAERRFAAGEIFVHQGFNPHAPLAALSPITALRRTMQAENAAREANLSLFLNDATPPFVLAGDQRLTPEQADSILDRWMARFRGFTNRHKPAVLWGGLKPVKLGLTPAEMEYLEGLKFLRQDYFMVFRVAPAMVQEMMGETGLSQGSSTDSQKVQWWENVGLAELDLIAGIHQSILSAAGVTRAGAAGRKMSRLEDWTMRRTAARRGRAAQSGQLYLWFDDNVIPALVRHRLAKLDQFEKIARWGYPQDEVGQWLDLGLPPHPVNVGLIPIGMQPVADIAAAGQPAPPAAAAAPAPVSRAADLLGRLEEALEGQARALSAKWKGWRKTLDRFLAARERAATRKWSRYFVEQRQRVLDRLEKAPERSAAVRADLDALLDEIFPIPEETEALLRRMAGLWQEHMADGWSLTNVQAGVPAASNPFQIDDPRIQEALRLRKIQGSKVNDTTREDLRKIIADALDGGLSNSELADNIAGYYAQHVGESSARPRLAAQMQVAGVVNDGQMAAARAAGGLLKGWLHGGSSEPRPAHLAAQDRYMAEPIELDELFSVNGHEADAPGSTELPVEETANCSCCVVFVKKGEKA